MATLSIPVKVSFTESQLSVLSSISLLHTIQVVKISTVPTTADEIGNALKPRENTSSNRFNWGT